MNTQQNKVFVNPYIFIYKYAYFNIKFYLYETGVTHHILQGPDSFVEHKNCSGK
ncbi:hypothetical protein HanXRQr2_Chr16g0750621 [Helianthus annuus]|uniref:Uncharacterized protein n=1 Tax=Helianthus annuus TaxID=4232 RepID=A0A9K3DR80_HELAN|nr:hypothetical protein HanXRQr2_Chr16g0750621 [Helianthus annuus]KAJ0438282.1 hypothetical protein HanHA300_Chr16g0612181 [Helianthus annuus]KAJ0460607.1 hypothetical protein HanHA89_Chr16g0662771 [Helianthus annuus]